MVYKHIPTGTSGKTAGAVKLKCESRKLSILISVDGTNAATVKVYNGADASGTIVFEVVTDTAQFIGPILVSNDIYVNCTGTGAYAMYYEWVD